MSTLGDTSDANLYRSAAIGSADRRNIDPNDSKIVELHRRHLLGRDRNFGTGANVTRRLMARTQ